MKTQLLTTLKNHPLITTLRTSKGNPRVLLFLEPLWGIPFTLIAPYATLYMQGLGISDIEIGLLLSVGAFFQVFFAFFGGILTDKFGRKNVTMIGDFFGWVIPCLVWAFSQNIWWFLIAVAFSSLEQVNQTAWVCLLVEDADQKQIVHIWNLIFIAAMLSVFFAPISGFFVSKTDVVPVLRVLYFLFAICMFIKNIVTWKYTKETQNGIKRKEATKNMSIWKMTTGYREVVSMIRKDKDTLLTLAVIVTLACTNIVTSNFFSLYATTNLGVASGTLAIFPIVRAGVIILAIFLIPKALDMLPFKVPMVIGFVIYIICQIMLIANPPGNLFMLYIYVIFDAIAFSLVSPRKEAMIARYVDVKERARILSLLMAISFALTIPFGYLTGFLSSLNRQFPFFLCLGFYIIITIILLTNKLGKIKT